MADKSDKNLVKMTEEDYSQLKRKVFEASNLLAAYPDYGRPDYGHCNIYELIGRDCVTIRAYEQAVTKLLNEEHQARLAKAAKDEREWKAHFAPNEAEIAALKAGTSSWIACTNPECGIPAGKARRIVPGDEIVCVPPGPCKPPA